MPLLQNAKTTEEKEVYLDIIKFQALELESQALERGTIFGTELISKIAGSTTEEEKAFFQKTLSQLNNPKKTVRWTALINKLEFIRFMLTDQ